MNHFLLNAIPVMSDAFAWQANSINLLLNVETFSWNETGLQNKFQLALHRVTWLVSRNLFELPLWDKSHEK